MLLLFWICRSKGEMVLLELMRFYFDMEYVFMILGFLYVRSEIIKIWLGSGRKVEIF